MTSARRHWKSVDKKIKTLHDTVRHAQEAAERVVGPESDLQKHRDALKQLSSQTLETRASFDTLKKEQASLEELRTQLRQTQGDLKNSLDAATVLKTELDQVRAAGAILGQDYARIREMSREAREDSGAAMEAVKDVEKRMGPLAQLHELSKNTEERLTSLNALAEHVTHKTKALESQKHTIDRAVVEANRLNELVWSMDAQIAKLNEGSKQIAHHRREPRAHGEAGGRDHQPARRRDEGQGRAGARNRPRREGWSHAERRDSRAR